NNGVTATDADSDGNLESAWFVNTNASMSVAAGTLTMDNTAGGTTTTGSSSYTTYFPPQATPLTPAQNQKLRVTWKFTPTGLGTDAGRGLRTAVVDSPASPARLTGNGSPGSALYTGYRLSVAVSTANLPTNALELRERADTTTTAAAFLSADAAWGATGLTS